MQSLFRNHFISLYIGSSFVTVGRSGITDDPLHEMTVGLSDMTYDLLDKIFYHLCRRGPLSLRHLLFVHVNLSFVHSLVM